MNKSIVATIQGKIANGELQEAYRNTGDFEIKMKDVWDACNYCVENFLDKIVFANDVLGIPPTKTFLEIFGRMNSANKKPPFTGAEAQKIGAFWGFVFQFCMGYIRDEKAVSINTLGIKKASRFIKKADNGSFRLADYMSSTWEEKNKAFVTLKLIPVKKHPYEEFTMITNSTDVSTLLVEAKACLSNVLNGEIFVVKDLLRGVEWQRIPRNKRLQLGARFFDEVNKGIITGIEPAAKNSQKQQRYYKLIPGVDECKGFWF